MDTPTVLESDKLIKRMKKAGTIHTIPHDELRPPIWLALAQLLFAAVLLYVIRNPVATESTTSYALEENPPKPAFVISIPLSTVAVAAPAKQKPGEVPM